MNHASPLPRRTLLGAAVSLAIAAWAAPDSKAAEESPMSFRWAVRSPDVEGLRDRLGQAQAKLSPETEAFKPAPADKEEYTDSSFAPLMVVAGAVALSVVLDAVLKFYRGYRHVGAVIDARGPALEIRELPSLPPGAILVLARDKPALLLEASSGTDVATLVKAVAPAGAK